MSNILFDVECARLDKTFTNGLSRYTQTNCQVTLTDDGYRIYRPPNLTTANNGNTMWGGLRINFTSMADVLIKGHTYVIMFHVKGQTTNSPGMAWSNNMGWEGGGLAPSPSNVSVSKPSSNFNGEQDVYYKFTINDDVYKVCTSSYSTFVAGNTYLSYCHFRFSYNYTSTGELGTDLYLTRFRMYDITDQPDMPVVNKTGVIETNGIAEGYDEALFGSEIRINNLIEI